MSFDTLFDIKNIICRFLYNLKDTINLYNLNKDHQENIIITNLYDISYEYKNKLSQQIIEQNKNKYVEKLYALDNKKIKNVNHIKNTLKILNCSHASKIDQNSISELNLIELNTTNNKKIENVNHMKNTLKILHCNHDSEIDQKGIAELNLIELRSTGNEKIKNVNHMEKTLKILDCGYKCGIDQNGISDGVKLYFTPSHGFF